jgi:hypothetical protein
MTPVGSIYTCRNSLLFCILSSYSLKDDPGIDFVIDDHVATYEGETCNTVPLCYDVILSPSGKSLWERSSNFPQTLILFGF